MNKNKLYFLKLEIQNHPLFEDDLASLTSENSRSSSKSSAI